MKIIAAEFVTSVAAGPSTGSAPSRATSREGGHAEGIPRDGIPQIAFAGRSNVGKSSLLNALCRRTIARTSAAPGKTRLANIYRVGVEGGPGGPGRWSVYFVDLPGYGYARGGPGAAKELAAVAEGYLLGAGGSAPGARDFERRTASADHSTGSWSFRAESRGERRQVLLLIDSRHPGLDADVDAAGWMRAIGVAPHVVATKIDKLSRTERARNLKALEDIFGTAAQPVSATGGEGLDELWTLIAKLARHK